MILSAPYALGGHDAVPYLRTEGLLVELRSSGGVRYPVGLGERGLLVEGEE